MMLWESTGARIAALVADDDRVGALEIDADAAEATLAVYDKGGAVASRTKLPKAKRAARGGDSDEAGRPSLARAAGAWLVTAPGEPALVRVEDGKKPTRFGAGGSRVTSVAVSANDVAIGRSSSLALWSIDGKRRWQTEGGPWTAVAIAGDVVAAIDADGALVFASRDEGTPLGALRLASTEPASTWSLVALGRSELVMALGDWLVWIDARTRKTIRRVRARAKVTAVAAMQELVIAGCEDGHVQAFRAATGEPRASSSAHEAPLAGLALGASLFTTDGEGSLRAWDRAALDVAPHAAAPVTALFATGDLVVAGDRTGAVRLRRDEHDLGALAMTEATSYVRLGRNDAVLAASSRVVMRAARPWTTPRPIALRAAATVVAADDAYAFAGSANGTIDVYDLERGAHVTSYALTDGDVSALCRLPGALLVVGTGALDGRIFVVDVAAAKVLHRIEAHDEAFAVTALACEPRGRIVASGSDDGTVVLVDPAKGRVLARIRVRETPVSVAFEGTGRRFACAFADGTAAVVSLGTKGASIEDLGLRGASRVAWGDDLVVGFKDGRIERVATAAKPAAARA